MTGPPSAVELLRIKRGQATASPAVASQNQRAAEGPSKMDSVAPTARRRSPKPPTRTAATSAKSMTEGPSIKEPRKHAGTQNRLELVTATGSKRSRDRQTASPQNTFFGGKKKAIRPPSSVRSFKSRDELKAPGRVQPKRAVKHEDVYDLSVSSESDTSPAPKKPRTTKAQPKKAAAKAPTARTSATGANVLTKKQAMQTTKAANEAPASAMRNTARNRMQKASPERAPKAVATLRKQKVKRPIVESDDDKENAGAAAAVPVPGHETLEDFEAQVVQYEDDDYYPADDRDFDDVRAKTKVLKATTIKQEVMATQLGSVKSRPVQRAKSRSAAPGAFQDDAIVIPDRQSSSSAASSPERRRPQTSRKPAETSKADIAETPAVLRSSPPLGNARTPAPLSEGLVDPETAKKSTIISFDKAGPRNQGKLSARKAGPGSVYTNRSSVPPAALRPEASTRARLQDRRTARPSSTAPSARSGRTERSVPPKNVANDVPDALAGFFKEDKVLDAQQPASGRSIAKASSRDHRKQIPHQEIDDDGGFMPIEDLEGTTLVSDDQPAKKTATILQPTASQQAMPPPPTKTHQSRAPRPTNSKPAHHGLALPPISPPKPSKSKKGVLQAASPTVHAKRKVVSPSVGEPSPKRLQTAPRPEALGEGMLQKRITIIEPSIFTRSATIEESSIAAEPSKRVPRKPSRHASYGSQSVDIQGSPIPEGMVVDGQATVLEIYSQQANISSDAGYADMVIARKTKVATKPEVVVDAAMLAPPSAQLQPISSNIKPRPAPPEAQSRAITAIGRTERGRLMVEDKAEKLQTDPFTSSSDAPNVRTGVPSVFQAHLQRTAAEHERVQTTQQPAEVDPDKTLVEEPQHSSPHGVRRTVSQSTASTSDHSSQESDTGNPLTDLSTWRNALLPHQMNLFDEIVNIAHRVVQHLVDQETAATDIVEDYQRRGVQLIEQMERSHAAQQQKYIAALAEKKKRLRKELAECSRNLNDGYEQAVTVKRQRSKRATGKSDGVEKVQDVLAQYC